MTERKDQPVAETLDGAYGAEFALDAMEQRGEWIAALFRLVVVASILFMIWTLSPTSDSTHPLTMVATVYGLASLFGLGLALLKIFHPALPFAFVFIDAAAVAIAITMLGHMQGMGMLETLSLPLFSLAFVILIHASLRYRPWLVAFGFMVFVVFFLTFPMVFDAQMPANMHQTMMGSGGMMATTQDGQVLPFVFLALATLLLFYIVRRTRVLAELSNLQGMRTAQLSRFFSPEIAKRLVSSDPATEQYGGVQKVGVLFIDIRGFTRLSEHISSEELVEFLSSFRKETCGIIFQHGGTVDKFVGDAILAVFGTPRAKTDDARRTFEAALAVSRAIRKWADERRTQGKSAALVGVGAHYGDVFAGVIESGDILEHTVIGDTVNVAQRLERMTRSLDANVILSEQVVAAAGLGSVSTDLIRKDGISLAGHGEKVTIYHDNMEAEASPAKD